MQFAAARLPRFSGPVRVGPIDPRGGSAEQLPAHPPIGVVRRPFKEPPLTCFVNGEPGAAIVAVNPDGDGHAITPLFVSITPSITLTDHDRKPASGVPP